jgi:hypothetical protein
LLLVVAVEAVKELLQVVDRGVEEVDGTIKLVLLERLNKDMLEVMEIHITELVAVEPTQLAAMDLAIKLVVLDYNLRLREPLYIMLVVVEAVQLLVMENLLVPVELVEVALEA